ncbi:MAG: UDP-N-acetylmuramoyl-L-alanine--D-glutamate ligase, partial [Gammaproteobacteria bacterium]
MSADTTNAPYAVIVGLGATGLSCARHLRLRGWRLAVTDTRTAPPQLPALRALDALITVRSGGLDAALLEGAVCVVASPGVSLAEPFFAEARRRGLTIVGDIELFARAVDAPVVGITGTNGKSTVTTLVALTQGTELYVLELSSFQLETTATLCCRAATVLNVSPDHLDRYASVASYAAAKARIFARCDTAVINLDDPLVMAMPRAASRTLGFSLRAAIGADYAVAMYEREWWLTRLGAPLMPVSAMKIRGLHNAANALAALALGEALSLPQPAMLAELAAFAGLPHRSQWVADV